MQAAPARYLSVSELYSTDEVELLLDEIRELEPTSCRGEDVQDFEIAGSGCGGGGAAGGRSPSGTEGTERSWDSHAQYRREPPRRPQPLAPLYCRPRYLLSLNGLCTLLVTCLSLCVCGCVWGACGARLGGGGGGAGAVRALQLGAATSALAHGALLALHLTALHRLMPLDWRALSGVCCAWSGCWLWGAGGALLHALLAHHAAAPARPRALLLAAVGLSLAGGAAAFTAVAAWARAAAARAGGGAGPRGAYRAVPPAPPPAPAPPL